MITFHDIEQAALRLQGQVLRTPCVDSRTLSQITGAQVFLKVENLQYTASFKERGACNKLSQLTPEERARGVVGMSVVIVMPCVTRGPAHAQQVLRADAFDADAV